MQRKLDPFSRILLLAGGVLLALCICGLQLGTSQWLAAGTGNASPYPSLVIPFKTLFDAGSFYPRWLAGSGNGYGSPAMVFMPPGYLYFTLPFTYLGLPEMLIAKLAGSLSVWIAICGYFSIARLLGNKPLTSVVLTLIATLNTIWFHAAFDSIAEPSRLALSIAVWGMYFLLRLGLQMDSNKPFLGTWVMLVFTSAITLYTQFHAGVLFTLLACAIALGQYLTMDKVHRHTYSVSILAAALIAIVLAAPYWYPLVTLGSLVPYKPMLDAGSQFAATDHIWGFTLWHWADIGTLDISSPLPWMELAFYLLILGCIYTLRHVAGVFPIVLLYIVASILMVPATQPAWQNFSLLQTLNDPRQLQLMTHLIEFILLCGGASYLFSGQRTQRLVTYIMPLCAILLAAACILIYHPFQQPHLIPGLPAVNAVDEMPPMAANALDAYIPYTPSGNQPPGNRKNDKLPLFTLLPDAGNAMNILDQREGITPAATLSVNRESQAPLWLQFNQRYFPGWKIVVKPTGLADSTAHGISVRTSDTGLMQLGFTKKGIYHVHAYYDGPPNWHVRNAAIAFISLWLLTCYLLSYRHYRHAGAVAKKRPGDT